MHLQTTILKMRPIHRKNKHLQTRKAWEKVTKGQV
jgi:hypothetical protein